MLDIENSENEGEGERECDFEDENEGPLADVSDMLTLDVIDYSLVYGFESIGGEVSTFLDGGVGASTTIKHCF